MSRRAPVPEVSHLPAPEMAARVADVERRLAEVERRIPSARPCGGCGSKNRPVEASHFSRGPGHSTEIRPLCPDCRTSFSPSRLSPSRSA